MGPVLGVAAAAEGAGLVAEIATAVGVALAATATGVVVTVALQEIFSNLPDCRQNPLHFQSNHGSIDNAPDDSTPIQFKLVAGSQFKACSATSLLIEGQFVQNQSIPFHYSFVMAKYKQEDGRPMWHAGLLIRADLSVGGRGRGFAMVERWGKSLLIGFHNSKPSALKQLKDATGLGTFEDMTETPTFSSMVVAGVLAAFLQHEFGREFKIDRDVQKLLQDDTATNCTLFAIRAGCSLGSAEDFQKSALSHAEQLR